MSVLKAGATCVAAIAVIEIPMGAWESLIADLQIMS